MHRGLTVNQPLTNVLYYIYIHPAESYGIIVALSAFCSGPCYIGVGGWEASRETFALWPVCIQGARASSNKRPPEVIPQELLSRGDRNIKSFGDIMWKSRDETFSPHQPLVLASDSSSSVINDRNDSLRRQYPKAISLGLRTCRVAIGWGLSLYPWKRKGSTLLYKGLLLSVGLQTKLDHTLIKSFRRWVNGTSP